MRPARSRSDSLRPFYNGEGESVERVLLFLRRPQWATGRWRSAGMRNGRNGRPIGRPSFVSVRGGEWGRDDPTGPGRRARRRGNPSVRRIPRPARSVRSHPRVALRNGPRRAPRVRAPGLFRARRARRTAFRAGRLRCPQRLRIRFRNPL